MKKIPSPVSVHFYKLSDDKKKKKKKDKSCSQIAVCEIYYYFICTDVYMCTLSLSKNGKPYIMGNLNKSPPPTPTKGKKKSVANSITFSLSFYCYKEILDQIKIVRE